MIHESRPTLHRQQGDNNGEEEYSSKNHVIYSCLFPISLSFILPEERIKHQPKKKHFGCTGISRKKFAAKVRNKKNSREGHQNRRTVVYACYLLHLLAGLCHHAAVLLEADGVDRDEAGGVFGAEVANLVHGRLAHVVQLLGVGPAAQDAEAALVDAAADRAVDAVLRGGDAGEEEFGFGGEVEAVVEDLGGYVSAIEDLDKEEEENKPWRS